MKIQCPCGHLIPDGADNVPTRAHVIADQDWDAFWEEVDRAVEMTGPSRRAKEAACMRLRSLRVFRAAWQCALCGRIHVEDPSRTPHSFTPEPGSAPPQVFGRAAR